MTLLNMLIGTMELWIAFIMLLLVIIIESVFLSKALGNTWINTKIVSAVLFSNLLSTFFGLIGVLSWSWRYISHLIENFTPNYFGLGFIFLAFILTLIFEIPINLLFLRRDFEKRNIIINSVYANVLTYILITILVFTIASANPH